MLRLHGLLAFAAFTQTLPATAATLPSGAPGAEPSMAFESTPVGNETLDRVVGTRLVGFTGKVRPLTDIGVISILQQVGQTSRIAMDNWWSQTGAALIASNLLVGR